MNDTVTIEQAVGKQIASGQSYIPGVQCTGANETAQAIILASPSGPPFHNGPAIVSAYLSAFNYSGTFSGGSATVNTAIRLQ